MSYQILLVRNANFFLIKNSLCNIIDVEIILENVKLAMKTEEVHFSFYYNIVLQLVKIPRISRDVQFRHTSLIPYIIRYTRAHTHHITHVRDLFPIPMHTYGTGKTTPHTNARFYIPTKNSAYVCLYACVHVCKQRRKRTWRTSAHINIRDRASHYRLQIKEKNTRQLHAQISYRTFVFCKVMYDEIEHPETSEGFFFNKIVLK